MMTNSSEKDNPLFRNVGKHLMGIFVMGIPFVCCALISLMNPKYIGVLVGSEKGVQPLGWILVSIIVVLAVAVYLGVAIIFDDLKMKQEKSPLSLVLSIIGIIIGVFAMIFLILLGPALLLFLARS